MQPAAQSIESILAAAVEIDSRAERRQFVEQSCGCDTELQRRVEELIENHFRAGSFLESPVPDFVATAEESVREGPGTVIGTYKLLEQIGEGGFGVVFMAEQQQPVRRKVALKVLKPGMDTRQVVARFEAERQALALMDHPNIARVFDGGATPSGRPFFVMELVKGVPLTEFCDQNQLTPRQRLELFLPVCQAVQHAHQKGIIHRDLKPSNILVTVHDTTPVPKVIDFGVAKALGQELTDKTLFTGFAQMVGTPLYMSPEQAGQSGLDIDTRSDIYALGVLLYELLTGTTPFDKERFREAAYDEMCRIIREEEPPRPSARVSTLGQRATLCSTQRQTDPKRLSQLCRGELDWVVMKCLEKDRNRRYETANGLAKDLQRYLADEPVLACPPSAGYRLRKFARRHTAALTTAGLVAAVLVLGTFISALLAVRAAEAEGLATERLRAETEAHQEADAARGRAVRERDQAQRRLYEARLAQAQAGRSSGRAGQRFASWQALTEAAQIAHERKLDESQRLRLRNEAIACLALVDAKLVKEWPGFPPGTGEYLSFDGDFTRYARCDAKGNISVRRVADDRELARLAGGRKYSWLKLSPDGDLLVDLLPTLRVWDWRRGAMVFQLPAVAATFATFAPDGRRLAVAQADGTVTLLEVGTWKALKRLALGFTAVRVALHPDGARLAAGGPQGRVDVRELATGRLLCRRDHPGRVDDLAWHPNGTLLAVACADSQVYLWNSATGRPHAVLHGHRRGAEHVAFSPDGDLLLSSSWDGTSRVWDPWSGRELVALGLSWHGFSRTGRRLVTRSGDKLSLWEMRPCREYFTLPNPEGTGSYSGELALSPDGRWLAVPTDRGVELRDLAAGRVRAFLPLHNHETNCAFHPTHPELITSGPVGAHAWPLKADAQALRIGPPRRLLKGPSGRLALDRRGRLLAVLGRSWGGSLVNLEEPSAGVIAFRHPSVNSITVSPDGRCVVSGSLHGPGIKVWEAPSGRLVRPLLPDEDSADVRFSPDGRWLLTSLDAGFGLWDVTSWRRVWWVSREPEDMWGGDMDFSADGKVLALGTARNAVQLVDPATGRPFAKLQAPPSDWLRSFRFSPDGSRLVAVAHIRTDHATLRVWDLRRIRERLRPLRLDWDLPPYPPAAAPGDEQPVRVELDLGELGATKK
jgi:WD40 repeat protein/serine/threonine protein kinase